MFDITTISDNRADAQYTQDQLATIGALLLARATQARDVEVQEDGVVIVYVSTDFTRFLRLPLTENGYAPIIVRADGAITTIEGNAC